MRQLLQKVALVAAVATLAACSAPQSFVPQLSAAGVHVRPADSAVGHP